MKSLPAIFLLTTVVTCSLAQTATIKNKAGEEKQVMIKAHSSDALFTDQGNIKYVDILSVDFNEENPRDKGLYEKLAAANVQVSFGKQVKTIEASPLIVNQKQEPVVIDIDKFREQRNLGKALQFVGVAVLATSIILGNRYAKKIGNDQEAKAPPEALPIAGLGMMGLGIVIDIDASRHLKRER